MTDGEKLIAIVRDPHVKTDVLHSKLADALEAAEKANTPTTPTDDELHALADVIEHVQTTWEADRDRNIEPLAEFTARGLLAAGFRRSEVPQPSADNRISRAITVLSWRPDHDGDDPARVRDDYMRRAQAADTALAILTENREGAF